MSSLVISWGEIWHSQYTAKAFGNVIVLNEIRHGTADMCSRPHEQTGLYRTLNDIAFVLSGWNLYHVLIDIRNGDERKRMELVVSNIVLLGPIAAVPIATVAVAADVIGVGSNLSIHNGWCGQSSLQHDFVPNHENRGSGSSTGGVCMCICSAVVVVVVVVPISVAGHS